MSKGGEEGRGRKMEERLLGQQSLLFFYRRGAESAEVKRGSIVGRISDFDLHHRVISVRPETVRFFV
jgi:hypothetical protein